MLSCLWAGTSSLECGELQLIKCSLGKCWQRLTKSIITADITLFDQECRSVRLASSVFFFFKLSVNVCIGEVTPHCTRIEKITDQPSPVCLGEKKKESNLSVLRLFSVLISEIISDVLKQFCHPGNCIFIACGGTRT